VVVSDSRGEVADPTAVAFLTSGDEITISILHIKGLSIGPEVLELFYYVYEYTTK